MEVEDLSGDASAFSKAKWIGQGMTYPVFEIPLEHRTKYVPDPNLSITQFLSHIFTPGSPPLFTTQQFRIIPRATHCLQLSKFVLLPSSSFLCTLDRAPRTLLTNLEITDYQRFLILCHQVQNIVLVLKSLTAYLENHGHAIFKKKKLPRLGKIPRDCG